jgi:hypothetical protein
VGTILWFMNKDIGSNLDAMLLSGVCPQPPASNVIRRRHALVVALVFTGVVLFQSACGAPKQPSVEDLSHHEDLSGAKLMTLRGARDGDRLDAEAMFSGRSLLLTVKMRFTIGAPTTLSSGAWVRKHSNGTMEMGSVAERSVSFAGGQNGSPSIGGSFDLVDATGARLYRVVLPLLELKDRLEPPRQP